MWSSIYELKSFEVIFLCKFSCSRDLPSQLRQQWKGTRCFLSYYHQNQKVLSFCLCKHRLQISICTYKKHFTSRHLSLRHLRNIVQVLDSVEDGCVENFLHFVTRIKLSSSFEDELGIYVKSWSWSEELTRISFLDILKHSLFLHLTKFVRMSL